MSTNEHFTGAVITTSFTDNHLHQSFFLLVSRFSIHGIKIPKRYNLLLVHLTTIIIFFLLFFQIVKIRQVFSSSRFACIFSNTSPMNCPLIL